MATNTPAKVPNVLRLTVGTGAEVPITFHGVPTVIGFSIQCIDAIALWITWTPGGTYSADNYWTLKSGDVYSEQDINWTPPEEAMYVRIPVSPNGDSTVEVIYWG